MTQAIISLLSNNATLCLPIESSTYTVYDLKQEIFSKTHIPVDQQVLRTIGGLDIDDQQPLESNKHILHFDLSARLLGGKGGFGSMLRAQGGRMNAQKTTNFEACRDLQGRRIRSVNEAKRLQEELDALPKREAEKRERLKRKIEEALKEREPRKHLFDDNEFLESKEEVVEGVKSAIGQALKKQKTSHNGNYKPVASTSQCLFNDDISDEDDDEEEEEEEEEEEKQEEEKKVEKEEVKVEEKEDKKKAKANNHQKKGKGKSKQ